MHILRDVYYSRVNFLERTSSKLQLFTYLFSYLFSGGHLAIYHFLPLFRRSPLPVSRYFSRGVHSFTLDRRWRADCGGASELGGRQRNPARQGLGWDGAAGGRQRTGRGPRAYTGFLMGHGWPVLGETDKSWPLACNFSKKKLLIHWRSRRAFGQSRSSYEISGEFMILDLKELLLSLDNLCKLFFTSYHRSRLMCYTRSNC